MWIPFQPDPSWYEKYWWREPAPNRTAYRRRRFVRRFCRACMPNRERLLRAADAMKVAKNPFAEILSAALRVARVCRKNARNFFAAVLMAATRLWAKFESTTQSMIRKSGIGFSEKITRKTRTGVG